MLLKLFYMIKEKSIEINITRRNISYYKNLGYDTKVNEKITVKIEDINKNSHSVITAICEICGKETKLRVHKYFENKNRLNYYSCKQCSGKKYKSTCLNKYGVDNYSKTNECKEKTKNTNLKTYGTEISLLNKQVKDKRKITNINKYGNEEPLQTQEIRNKSSKTIQNKYGVSHFSKTSNFKTKMFNNWKKNTINRLIEYKISQYKINDNKTIDIFCNKCNKFFNITMKNIYQRKMIQKTTLCTHCKPLNHSFSTQELLLLNYIKKYYKGKIIINTKDIIPPFELDIYLPDLKLAFEFNGIYWHSDKHKDKNYHKNKSDLCNSKNIQLVHIWEHEWLTKKDIIKSIINNYINYYKLKINIDNCNIKELTNVNNINKFLIKNNIDGYIKSNVNIGLFHKNELISLMSFIKNKNNYILSTFCNKNNTYIKDSGKKLFEYFKSNYNFRYIFVYVNRNYDSIMKYEQLGFINENNIEPEYTYIDKHFKPILKENIKTNRKYYKIYNSGIIKMIYK